MAVNWWIDYREGGGAAEGLRYNSQVGVGRCGTASQSGVLDHGEFSHD